MMLKLSAEEMDQADSELRETITHIWPLQAKKMLDLLVPRNDVLNAGKMTVGKIYAGLLILESWRSTRFAQTEPQGVPVSVYLNFLTQYILFLCILCVVYLNWCETEEVGSNEARVSTEVFVAVFYTNFVHSI